MLSQTEQSRAEQSCLADPTFDESVHGEVRKAVGKIVGMIVGKVVGMTIGKAVGMASLSHRLVVYHYLFLSQIVHLYHF